VPDEIGPSRPVAREKRMFLVRAAFAEAIAAGAASQPPWSRRQRRVAAAVVAAPGSG